MLRDRIRSGLTEKKCEKGRRVEDHESESASCRRSNRNDSVTFLGLRSP